MWLLGHNMRYIPELKLFPNRTLRRQAALRSAWRMKMRLSFLAVYAAFVVAPVLAVIEIYYPFLITVLGPILRYFGPSLKPLIARTQGPPVAAPYTAIFVLVCIYALWALSAPYFFRWLVGRFRTLLRVELNRVGVVVCVPCAYDLRGLGHRSSCPECGAPNPPVLSQYQSRLAALQDSLPDAPPADTFDKMFAGWIFICCAIFWARALNLQYQPSDLHIVLLTFINMGLVAYNAFRKRRARRHLGVKPVTDDAASGAM